MNRLNQVIKMEDRPNYYSILTADVRYDERLKKYADCKVLFSEITALSNKYGYCNASNSYFSKLYDRPKPTISKWINLLIKLGYLKSKMIYKENSKEVRERRLYPITTPINADVKGGINADVKGGINADVKDNITSINNINISDKSNSESNNKNRFNYSKFINSINETANTNFRNSSNNRKLIHARLEDGYTKEDIAKVVTFKANQWKDNEKMKKYIVLTTLLRPSNFDKYIQEVESTPEPQKEKKRKVPPKEKERKDDIEEKIYQYKLFLSEHPENELVRKELEKLERNKNKSDDLNTEIINKVV